MNTIVVTYDPIDGDLIADGQINAYVDEIVKKHKSGQYKGYQCSVSNFLVIDEIRARISEESIDHNFVIFKFKGETITVDKNGRIGHWPNGFGSAYENILFRIVGPTLKRTLDKVEKNI